MRPLVLVDGRGRAFEVQTEKTWDFSEEFRLPRGIIINKLDRERSSFDRTLNSVPTILRPHGDPDPFAPGFGARFQKGVGRRRADEGVHLFKRTATAKGKEAEIPADLRRRGAEGAAKALIEMVAEGQRRAARAVLRHRNARAGADARAGLRDRGGGGAAHFSRR